MNDLTRATLCLSVALWAASPGRAAEPAGPPPHPAPAAEGPSTNAGGSPGKSAADPGKQPAGSKPKVSLAETILNLRRSIEADEKQLEELKVERDDQSAEYTQAQAKFELLDGRLEEKKKALASIGADDPAGRKAAQDEFRRFTNARSLAKDRFDLAIEDRKLSAEQVTNLEQKLQRDREALRRLEAREDPVAAKPDEAAATAPAPAPALVPAPSLAPAVPAALAPTAAPLGLAPPAGAAPAAPASGPAEAPSTPNQGPVRKELVAAQEDARTKAEASKEAEAEATSITERLESLEKNIALEQKLLATGRKQQANATEIHRALTDAFRRRSLEHAPKEVLDRLLVEVKKIDERLQATHDDVNEHSTRLEQLQTERSELHAERLAAARKAEEARAQVKAAEAGLKQLENPLSPLNVLRWLIEHGPRMLTIILAIAAGHWLSKLFSQRVIRLLAHSGARGSSVEREARARTLIGVFHNAASLSIIVGGGLMILQEAGIPIAPLLGGAAVFGLAVAFGAQNLIRDYFYGFVILLENQYKLNDVVRIGELSGQVEKITLRMTVLRDLEGRVHFMPNGQITAVTNMTHGWSRALFAVGVAYKEDVDRVMAVLMSLSHDLRADPAFGSMILEDATMLGVDELADSAVVIKFFIKTRPLQQWAVKRELLRRIKNRFDELGIEIPFPHRTVYHHLQGGADPLQPLNQPGQILHAGRPHRQPA